MNHYIEYTNNIEDYKYVGELPSDSRYVKRLIGKHIDGVLYNIDKSVSVLAKTEKTQDIALGNILLLYDNPAKIDLSLYLYTFTPHGISMANSTINPSPWYVYDDNTQTFSFETYVENSGSKTKSYYLISSDNVLELTDENIDKYFGGSTSDIYVYKGKYIAYGIEANYGFTYNGKAYYHISGTGTSTYDGNIVEFTKYTAEDGTIIYASISKTAIKNYLYTKSDKVLFNIYEYDGTINNITNIINANGISLTYKYNVTVDTSSKVDMSTDKLDISGSDLNMDLA